MYIPIIKNRTVEFNVLSSQANKFGDEVIPFIEIVEKRQQLEYVLSEEGKRTYHIVDGKRKAIRRPPVEITLNEVTHNFPNMDVFVQYFRYDIERYGRDYSQIPESYWLNDHLDDYIHKTLELSNNSNFIPVLIIKPNVRNENLDEFENCINEFNNRGKNFGLRIDVQSIVSLKSRILDLISLLGSNDYLFIDLLEESFVTYEDEIEDILDIDVECKKIVLKAYRKREVLNNSFNHGENLAPFPTDLFNNYSSYGFDGFGDFCGVPDRVPNQGRGKYSTVLIYNNIDAKYISYRSHQIGGRPPKGDGGDPDFASLKALVLTSSRIITHAQYSNCPGIARIISINKGYFKEWKEIAMLSFIHGYLQKKGLVL